MGLQRYSWNDIYNLGLHTKVPFWVKADEAEARIKELEEENERHHRIAEKFIDLNKKNKVQLANAEDLLFKIDIYLDKHFQIFQHSKAHRDIKCYFKDKEE